jgi:hypothetical protein
VLLPDKHITLAESILGLGAFVLHQLDRPRTVDQVYHRLLTAREDQSLHAFHDFDSLIIAVTFLYSLGAVDLDAEGRVFRCAS